MENNQAKVLLSSQKAVGPIVKDVIGGCIVWPFILGVLVSGLAFFIPLIGIFISSVLWIISLLIFVFSLIGVIKDLVSYVEVTDKGVRGKAGFKSFDVPYSQLDGVGEGKRVVMVCTTILQNPQKPDKGNVTYLVEPIKNYKEIMGEANLRLEKYNASQADGQTE